MQRLVDSNPGVSSRFPNKLDFADYTIEEMLQIAESMVVKEHLKFGNSKGCKDALRKQLEKLGNDHANGRSVRNIVEDAKRKMAVRLSQNAGGKTDKADLVTLVPEDF